MLASQVGTPVTALSQPVGDVDGRWKNTSDPLCLFTLNVCIASLDFWYWSASSLGTSSASYWNCVQPCLAYCPISGKIYFLVYIRRRPNDKLIFGWAQTLYPNGAEFKSLYAPPHHPDSWERYAQTDRLGRWKPECEGLCNHRDEQFVHKDPSVQLLYRSRLHPNDHIWEHPSTQFEAGRALAMMSVRTQNTGVQWSQ